MMEVRCKRKKDINDTLDAYSCANVTAGDYRDAWDCIGFAEDAW